MKRNGDIRWDDAPDRAIITHALGWQNQEFDCWSKHIQNDVRFFIRSTRSAHQASVRLESAVFKSDREAFAARAMSHRVRIGDFEAAFLQVLAIIEHRAANKKCALGIDNQPDI